MRRITVRRRSPLYVGMRVAVIAVVAAVVIAIPQYYEPFRVNQFTRIVIVAIAVLGLNLLTGFNGQISIGHSAFFGIGAYTTTILVADHGWPAGLTAVLAAVIAFGVGALCGIPALRIKGLYLALVTLALAIVFPLFVKRFSSETGGSQGKSLDEIEPPEALDLENDQWRYYVVIVVAIILFVLVRNLVHSRVGRALIAIRDNETAAEVMGINLARFKTVTFGISSAIAAVAGSLFAMVEGFVSSQTALFNLTGAIEFLAAMVIGGAATVVGPVFGAFFVEEIPRLLSDYNPALSQVLYGALLVALMFFIPSGVVGLYRRVRSRLVVVEGAPEPAVVTGQAFGGGAAGPTSAPDETVRSR
jgi:branched-chain amino acid transport system permease protein